MTLKHREKLKDIYYRFDHWTKSGRLDLIDDELSHLVIDDFDFEVIVGFLVASAEVKDELKSWKSFTMLVKKVLSDKFGEPRASKIMIPYLRP